ncbi:MAG: hypothetical protein QOD51_2865, partial [Candidatus Eremiobacteraeota bacterium]|nr:hypothetical protein [Candidatus Eremiobacteraeota bacterium]
MSRVVFGVVFAMAVWLVGAAPARAACANLVVTVVNGAAAAVPGAAVTIRAKTLRTGTDGRAVIACGAARGERFVVAVSAAGYEHAAVDIDVPDAGEAAVRIALQPATLTSIGGTTTSTSRIPLNTQPGSYNVVSRV